MENADASINELDFTTILENYDSENEMLRITAANIISRYRDEKVFDYLENLFLIITNQESSQHIKNIAIILSYKAFELIVSTNQFCTKYQYIEENDPGLLMKFLNESLALFFVFPRDSGYLFSTIFIICHEHDENNNIIQTLCERIKQENDLNFINGALTGMEDLCQLQLSPSQYYSILDIVFAYIDSPDDQSTENIKVKSISIIKRLIPTIDEAFDDFEMSNKILQSIQTSISKNTTKTYAYQCISFIIAFQFHVFTSISNDILSIAYEDLNNAKETMDEALINSICFMLTNIATNTDYYEDANLEEEINKTRTDILKSCFSNFFYSLLPLTFNSSLNSDISDDSSICKYVLKTISYMIGAIPDFSFSILLDFFEKNFFQNQNEQISPEIFCNLISFIVTFCGIEKVHQFLLQFSNFIQEKNEIQIKSFSEMIEQIALIFLNNSLPQVKIAAINFLRSIIKRPELYKKLDNTFVLYYIDNSFEFFEEGHSIAVHACYFLRKIIKLSKKLGGISEIDLVSLFLKLKDYCGCTDDRFACSIFDCIELIIGLLDVDQFQEIFEPVMKMVFESFEDQFLNRNQLDVLFMFRKYCDVARDKSIENRDQFNCEDLFSPVFNNIYELFTGNFDETNNLELLNALSYLGIVSPDNFKPHLTEFITILIEVTNSFFDSHSRDTIVNFVNFIKFLDQYFDLQIFIGTIADFIIKIMEECISPQFNDLNSFSELMILHSIFIRKYFSEVSEKVIPLIELFSEVISKSKNINDDDLRSIFLIRCSILLKNIFEKADHDDAIKLLEISFELTKDIFCFLNDENTSDNQFEQIIFLFAQMSNISPEPFQELSQTEEFKKFFSYLLQNEELNSTANTFLATIGISVSEQ